MRGSRLGSLAMATLCGLAACQTTGGAGGNLDGTSWELVSQQVAGAMAALPTGVSVGARFAGARISGSGGCNSYSGDATTRGANLSIGALATTQMACIGEASAVEAAYFANLGRAASFTATGDGLTVFDDAGRSLLVFRAGRANPLIGAWKVTGINNGREAVVSLETGSNVTATFSEDGKVSGSGGCNQYNGSYTLSAQNLSIGPLRSTRMACEPAIMAQETQFFAAMGKIATIDPPSRGMLMLRDLSGATQVILGSP